MALPFTLGLDVGTTGLKGVLVDSYGKIQATALAEYVPASPAPGLSEQDPEVWWHAATEVCRTLTAQLPSAASIAAVGLSGQMHGAVFLDESGSILRPAILWNDQRTAEECEIVMEQTGGRIVEWTMNPPRTAFTVTKIVWLRRREPAIYARLRHVVLPKDYLRYRLSGLFATDVTDASGTNLLDVRNRRWSAEALDSLKIPQQWLGDVVESNEVAGRVSAAAADQTGLRAGTPIVGGGADQAAAAIGNGVCRSGSVSLTLGTSGVAYVQLDSPITDPSEAFHTFCHAVPGTWQMMAGVLSAGGSLRWYRDVVGKPEADHADRMGRDAYEVISEAAAGAALGSEGLVFLPYLTGERSPYADPAARGAWFGLTARHDRSHLARSVLEGVSFAIRDLMVVLERLNVPLDELRVAGGGAKGSVWLQILADILGQSVLRTTATDASAYGAALLAMSHALGETVVSVADRWISTKPGASPDAARVERYAAYYDVYHQLYPATATHMHTLSALASADFVASRTAVQEELS